MTVKTRNWLNGDGSIGVAYQIDVCCGRFRVRNQFDSYAEAVREEARVRTELLAGLMRTGRETVKDVALNWLAHIRMFKEAGTYQPSHLRNCKNYVMNYIVNDRARLVDTSLEHHLKRMVEFDGTLGFLPLREIKSQQIFEFLIDLQQAGGSTSLLEHIRKALVKIFEHARLTGLWVGENPARFRMPKGQKGETKRVQIPSENNIELLWTVATEWERDMLQLSVDGAPRLGEMLATRYGAIKYSEREDKRDKTKKKIVSELHINFTVNEVREIVGAKTESGNRIVPIPPAFAKKIRERMVEQGKKEDDFVFNKNGQMFVHTTFYESVWYPLRARAVAHQQAHEDLFEPLPHMTWKSLRHFGISRWIQANYTNMMLKTYAGHKSIDTINTTYAHLIAGRDKVRGTVQIDMTLSPLFDTYLV